MNGVAPQRRLYLSLACCLLVAGLCLARIGGQAARAAGASVLYRAGWNIVAGPTGTVFTGTDRLYALGPGDTAYVGGPADASTFAGRGYWAFFPVDTPVTLNGAGATTATTIAPSGQWLLIGNPSGIQAATVTGADQVMTWDPSSNSYQAVSQLAAGQGAWAVSLSGGGIIVGVPGAPTPVPANVPVPAAAPAPTPSPTPVPATVQGQPLIAIISMTCYASSLTFPSISSVIVDIVVLVGGRTANGAVARGTVTVANGAPLALGPEVLFGGGARHTLNLPKVTAGTLATAHVDATYAGQPTSADGSCIFA